MGVDAAGSGILYRVSGADAGAAVRNSCTDSALDAVPHGDRCGADQAAARQVLARPDLPLLPLRNAAAAQFAELVFSPDSCAHASLIGAVQSLRSDFGSVRVIRAATDCVDRRRPLHPAPALADCERKLLVVE